MEDERIMIVEDDGLLSMVLEEALTRAGYEVCAVVARQDDAIRAGALHKPTLAIVDISLSPGDGRIVAEVLHREHGTAVLFASAQCEDVAKRAPGAVGFVSKPYRPQHVLEALRAAAMVRCGEDPGPLPINVSLRGWTRPLPPLAAMRPGSMRNRPGYVALSMT